MLFLATFSSPGGVLPRVSSLCPRASALHKVANKFWESRGQHLDKTIDQVRASRASDFGLFSKMPWKAVL